MNPAVQEKLMASNKMSGFKPGVKAPASGQYQEVGPRGGRGREVTTVKGKPLPPSTKSGSTYELVDPSRNKSGRGR